MTQSVVDALEIIEIEIEDVGLFGPAACPQDFGGLASIRCPVWQPGEFIEPREPLDPRSLLISLDGNRTNVYGSIDDPAFKLARAPLGAEVECEGAYDAPVARHYWAGPARG